MRLTSYAKVVGATTINIVGYLASGQRFLWLEGRVHRGVFRNWIRGYRYAPTEYRRPTSQPEIVALVKSARSLRVFGSGHSFNEGVVSDGILVSLDEFAGLVSADTDRGQITVKSGTRVRDVVQILADHDLAFAALPSHDAQSIGGILSTDVHGTGRDWGFVSESVVRLTLVDGTGEVHQVEPPDELFRAAVGGAGAVGIITEVTLQGVPRFNVEQKTEILNVAFVRPTWTNCWRPTNTSASTSTRSARPARSTPGTPRIGRRPRTVTLASCGPSHSTRGWLPRWATFSPTAVSSGSPRMCRDCPS